MRGATVGGRAAVKLPINFNPRTPCGVRLYRPSRFHELSDFNPRTPCGVRRFLSYCPQWGYQFQSTHPVRGATFRAAMISGDAGISIHAPRAGCDADSSPVTSAPIKFQSTHPVRGATTGDGVVVTKNEISIHAPRAGCDVHDHQCTHHVHDFNPRTPCGVRL